MKTNPLPGTVLVAGTPTLVTGAVVDLLALESVAVLTEPLISGAAMKAAFAKADPVHGLVLVLPEPQLGAGLLDVSDDMLEASMAACVDLIQAMGVGAAGLADGGSLVVVGSRGHLGGWGGAHEMAFAGATVGLMRSVALAHLRRGVRANVIALDLQGPRPGQLSDVALMTSFLLSQGASLINGQVILANAGRSLQLREAIDRTRAPDAKRP